MKRIIAMIGAALWLTACGAEDPPAPRASDSAGTIEGAAETVAEAKALMAQADVAAAIACLEAKVEQTNAAMVALTEIPAPPFGEDARAEDFARRLKALGLSDVSIDAVGNVIALRRGSTGERRVAVVAHVDTVFPLETNVTVTRDGDIFKAPGIADNTRGLAAVLSVVEAMEAHDLRTEADIMFVGSVGEEGLGNLRGVRHLMAGDHGIDSFIAVDGGRPNRLVTSAVGSNRYRVTFKGPGGHSYGAFGRAHPHQALAQAIAEFTVAAEPITQEAGAKATFSVGRIGGGTSINSIPFESWMEVDMRSVDPRKLDALDAAFKSAIEVALERENARRKADDAMTVEIEDVGKRPAGQGDTSAPLIQNAIAAMEAIGMDPNITASSTDANIPIWLGVPALTVARGGQSKDSHSLDETWDAEGAATSEAFLLLLILMEAQPAGIITTKDD